MIRIVSACALLCLLTGCAEPAHIDEMAVSMSPATQVSDTSPLNKAVHIATVTGGQDTNPLWTSQVSNGDFQKALEQSLAQNGLLGGGDSRYQLNAILLELKQPLVGFDMTVTSTVHYTLSDPAGKTTIFDQTITEPFTATISDAFAGVERLRLANQGSIKKNISTLLEKLSHVSLPASAPAGGTPTSQLQSGKISLAVNY